MDLNLQGKRANKARFAKKYGKTLKAISIILIVLLLIGAVALGYFGQPLAWLILTLAAWPTMLLLWYKGDLKNLKPTEEGLAGVLEGDLLGSLPKTPSPRDIMIALANTTGGNFLSLRLALPLKELAQLTSNNPSDSEIVWRDAFEIHNGLADRSEVLLASTVAAALLRTDPNLRQFLAQSQLDENDVVQVAQWYAHLDTIIADQNKPRLTGGVGRDWSFGYIPTLRRFGTNLSEKYALGRSLSLHLECHDDLVDAMVETFSAGGRQNVTLIGAVGSGKTSVVEAFAERLMDGSAKIPKSLQYNQVISLDSSALISAAPGRGQVEQLVNILLTETYRAKNIILCLDNAHMFFEDGVGSVDITNILQPILENGAIRMILTMEEQRFLQISQRNAALAAAMNRLQVLPPNENDTLKIMEDQSIRIEHERKVVFTYQALRESYKLAERYVQDVAQPKRSIQLMEASASSAAGGLVTADSVRQAIESTIGVKVGATDDQAERQRLLSLEDKIHERMINQVAAVDAVSAALRRARAGVRSQNRPIGTFLFLGPTGVGKTELAKTLSEVYFGNEGNMVRVDMNSFVSEGDVARLIADGAQDASSLTAQIMKNPFSVVLLDEIEKAHTSVLSTLLQVLDEGVLRDINNHEVSFRDAIIIATSNAGANRIREYIEAGLKVEDFQEQFKNELIDSRQFTPEFLNRFDEVVVFRPLTKEELLQVIDLQLKGVNKTLADQKIAVSVTPDAKQALVEAGYDPRLGARPMRRVVQRTVEDIVSRKILSGELQPGMELNISLADILATGALNQTSEQ